MITQSNRLEVFRLLVIFLATFISQCIGQSKLTLSQFNAVDTFGVYNTKMPVRNLFDEQAIAGDPLNHPNNAQPCITPWLPTIYPEYYPISNPQFPGPVAVVDLESVYKITDICIYIMNKNSSNWLDFMIIWNFTASNPFQSPLLSLPTAINQQWGNKWNCFNITDITAGFITASLHSPPSNSFTEIVVYGEYAYELKNEYNVGMNQLRVERKSLRTLMGSTGYGFTPTENFTNTVGAFRQWQMWPWIEGGDNTNYPGYPNNQNRYECTTVTAPNAFCQDDVLTMQRKNNVSVHSVVWSVPQWVHNWNDSENGWKPISDDVLHQFGATVNPQSYIMLADHMFQKAARYGRVKVSDKLLKLAPNRSLNDSTPQPRLSGLDLLDWVEIWNEPNCGGGKNGRESWFSNLEIVAMQSAIYDGHLGSMPNTVGIKSADPSMNVSFGGLCSGSNNSAVSDDFYGVLYNWQTILWWSNHFRNGSIPAEALAYHIYARNCTGCWPTIGVSPEEYRVYEMAKELVQWRDQNMPGVQVWLTEFGYDTVAPSEILAPPIGTLDSEEIQGMWIMRTILAAHAAGVSRSNQFVWSDVCAAGSWCTCGLVDVKYSPKKSYYYFVAMYRNLRNYFFVSRDCNLMNGNVCVQLYEYEEKYAYVVWCPTSENHIVKDYILQVSNVNGKEVSLVTPTVGNPDGKHTILKVNENAVVLDVSELPVFVMQ